MTRQLPPFSVSLLLFVVVALVPPTLSFEQDDLVDVYRLHVGSAASCMRSFEITDDDVRLTYGDVRMNGNDCPVDDWLLKLYANGHTGDSKLHDKLVENPASFSGGAYFSSVTSELLRCGDAFIGEETLLLFLKMNGTLTVDAKELFDEEDAKSPATEDDPQEETVDKVVLKKGYKYLGIGERCLYRADKHASAACFPGGSVVTVREDGRKKMSDVKVGDFVLGGNGYTQVIAFAHREQYAVWDFLSVQTRSGAVLTVSAGHYLPVDGRGMVVAGDVNVGDRVKINANDDGKRISSDVVAVAAVSATGLYNPLTTDGSIVVDGVVASTFTNAVGSSAAWAHAALAPLRYLSMGIGKGMWFMGVRNGVAKAFEHVVDSVRPVFEL